MCGGDGSARGDEGERPERGENDQRDDDQGPFFRRGSGTLAHGALAFVTAGAGGRGFNPRSVRPTAIRSALFC